MDFIVALLITAFAYLIVPIIIRLVNGKVDEKTGKIIAFLNALIVCVIFAIIRSSMNDGETMTFSAPVAVLYYFISKSILIKNEEQDDVNDDGKENDDKNQKNN